jgi:hydrophobic/amphiphilic exporter-1 (mainly G- bacteria), HAE1 family
MSESLPQSGLLSIILMRPIGVMMSLALVILLGMIAYFKMPLQLLPDGLSPPFMWVSIPTLSASPEENEQLVAKPIEDALSTLAEIDRLRTFIRTNSVGFAINLHPKSDHNLSYLRIRSRLRRYLPQLPEGAQFAMIWRHDPNDDPLYAFSITYPADHTDPAQVIKSRVVKAIERLPGVSRVELKGIEERSVRIKIRPQSLKDARLSAQDLLRILREDHFTLTAGQISEGERTVWVNASSRFDSIEALRARPITQALSLGDIADIELSPSLNPRIQRVNGQKAASVVVYKVSSENTIEVATLVQKTINTLFTQDRFLKGYEKIEFFSQGEFIQSSLNQIKDSALYGGLIALFSLWLFLRSWSLTLMITTSIPVCLLVTVALLYLNGQSLNVLSMMGIILSVGMVIDNAIVVLEQITRHRREGLTPRQAALQGTQRVGLAITLATATSLVVFLPLMIVSNQPMLGFFITRIGEPVCYALGASLVVALIHLPTASQWASSTFATPKTNHKQAQDFERKHLSLNALPVEQTYHNLLTWVLKHRLSVSLMSILFFLSVGFPAGQLNRVDKDGGAFKTLTIHIRGPLNCPQKHLLTIAKQIETEVLTRKQMLDVKTVVVSRGWSPEHLKVDLYLVSTDKRSLDKTERDQQLKALLPERPGYRIILRRGSGNQSEGVNISVYGPYMQDTQAQAEKLLSTLKEIPEVDNAELDLPEGGLELRLGVDTNNAFIQQLTPAWISASINAELQERPIGELMTLNGATQILITPDSSKIKLDHVAQVVPPIPRPQANRLLDQPLDGVVNRFLQVGSGKIRRKKRRVEVNILVTGEDGQVMSALERELSTYQLPLGFGIDYGERFKERSSNERGGLIAVIVGIVLVFCLMGVLFESLLTPLAILGTIPLAFVGAIWMLWFCGTSFEIMAMIGGVILVGVVVNNGIVLIDQVQMLRRSGVERDQAVLAAASTRLRPILMTAITTIGGLIPMAFGGVESVGMDYRPLGQVVVGGLLTSTLLTLVVIPLLYTLIDDLGQAPKEGKRWLLWLHQVQKY